MNGKLQEYDQNEARNQQVFDYAQANQMEYEGRTLYRWDNPEAKMEDTEYWFDGNMDVFEVPNDFVEKWEKKRQTKSEVTMNKVDQSYSEMSKYNVVEDEQGNRLIAEPATIEQANALKEEVEKFMEGNATILTKLIPNEDKTNPQMYQLTIVFKDTI